MLLNYWVLKYLKECSFFVLLRKIVFMRFYRIRGNPICEIKIGDNDFEIVDEGFKPNSMKVNFDLVDRIEIQGKEQGFFDILATMMLGVCSSLGIFKIDPESKYIKKSTTFFIYFKDNSTKTVEILNAFDRAVETAVNKLNDIFIEQQYS